MKFPDWVVLELTQQGEEEDPETLKKLLARVIKGCEIFIPASISTVGDSRVVHRLIPNYVFVKHTFTDSFYLKFEGTRYIATVLTVEGPNHRRKVAGVPHKEIEKIRKQLQIETQQGIEIGDLVEIMSGPYKGITATVIEDIHEENKVQVRVSLRSKDSIVTLPRSFFRYIDRNGDSGKHPVFSPYLNKIARVREWVQCVKPFAAWSPPTLTPIQESYNGVLRLKSWQERGTSLAQLLIDPPEVTHQLEGGSILDRYATVEKMSGFISKAPILFQLKIPDRCLDIARVHSKLHKLNWLLSVLERLETIQTAISQIERSLPEWKPTMVQNLIIDGNNLAHRVSNALRGVQKPLTDKDGKPTSLVYGFLKSLAALHRRFDRSKITVVWDGSKQRRAAMYSEYKAGRSPHNSEMYDQIDQLKGILPLLGVAQAYNPKEEADDLIACLVHKFAGQSNLIVSTDRDFLQLVTYTTLLMVPKVGASQEVVYDPDRVVVDYGVPPAKMVSLRSLLGDSSDNLPGVPRVPKKTLVSLLKTYGNLEDLYKSNLSGTTATQFEKITAFQTQALLNYQVMRLHIDLEFTTIESNPDVTKATEVLTDLSIQPEGIIESLLAPSKGFSKSN